jgi:hypothetical protein
VSLLPSVFPPCTPWYRRGDTHPRGKQVYTCCLHQRKSPYDPDSSPKSSEMNAELAIAEDAVYLDPPSVKPRSRAFSFRVGLEHANIPEPSQTPALLSPPVTPLRIGHWAYVSRGRLWGRLPRVGGGPLALLPAGSGKTIGILSSSAVISSSSRHDSTIRTLPYIPSVPAPGSTETRTFDWDTWSIGTSSAVAFPSSPSTVRGIERLISPRERA